jgi:hypothetical protein
MKARFFNSSGGLLDEVEAPRAEAIDWIISWVRLLQAGDKIVVIEAWGDE